MVASIEDYSASIVLPKMVKAPMLQGGHPVEKNGRLIKYAGGFCVVFPYVAGRNKYAVRCWHTPVESVHETQERVAEVLRKSGLPYFVPYEYVPKAILTAQGLQPAAVMEWTDAEPLKKYIGDNLDRPRVLDALADAFLGMAADLHKRRISHGDLQHGNIMVRYDGVPVLVDYDSMFVPGLERVPDDIKGLPGYQHPARMTQRSRSEVRDYFSELVIYTSIRTLARHPGLWRKLQVADSETMLFSEEDLQSGGRSEIFRLLKSDVYLRPLGRAIQDALAQTSLDRILPVEDAVHGRERTIVESLSRKWEAEWFRPDYLESNINLFNRLAEIASKW